MAGRGPTPKPDDQRQRRNATVPMTELVLGSTPVDAPALPGKAKFLKATRDWYDTWCRSPQASQLTVTDWQRLHMLAPLVDQYWRNPDKAILAEIRLNERELGATVESRQRLRWTVKQPSPEEAAASSKTAKPRKRRDPRLRLVK